MSRLVNPGAGEVFDRLTILHLKVAYGQEGKRDTAHWSTELGALMPKIQARNLSGIVLGHLLELATMNSLIWHAEDRLREYRIREDQPPDQDPAHSVYTCADLGEIRKLAFRLQRLNDRRAQLITLINAHVGDPDHQEK